MKIKYKRYIILSLIFCLVIILPCFISITKLEGNSMYPTITNGQYVVAYKRHTDINRNDIIICRSLRNPENQIIKRVIAVPGDTIEIINEREVFVNNKKIYEPYVILTSKENFVEQKITLKENEYFIMGDNRANSFDSRMGGPVMKQSIFAKVLFY